MSWSKQSFLGGWGLDTQAFSASGAQVHGFELAALDTLHDGLSGHAVGEGGLQHGEPAVGGVVDEQVADVVGEPDSPGRAGGDLLAGDESVAGIYSIDADDKDTGEGWFAYVAVNDLATALARATSEGGEVVREPWDVPGVGRIAIVNDNAGNTLGWMTPSEQ